MSRMGDHFLFLEETDQIEDPEWDSFCALRASEAIEHQESNTKEEEEDNASTNPQ